MEAVLALIIAESSLNPRSERWGSRTAEAVQRLKKGASVQDIIDDVWPDISFGYCQRIVKYHWSGDGAKSEANVLRVREEVFGHPERDILEAASKFAGCLQLAGGDILEGLCVYNFGHVPKPQERQTSDFINNSASYKLALARAREILGRPM